MDDADLESRGGDGTLDRAVVAAGPFDDHDQVADLGRSRAERTLDRRANPAGLLDHGGSDEDAAVEVGEHPFGTGLGAIDGDDTEVLGSDPLDTGTDHATSLVDGLGSGSRASWTWESPQPWERPPGKSLGRRPTPPQEVCMALQARGGNEAWGFPHEHCCVNPCSSTGRWARFMLQ